MDFAFGFIIGILVSILIVVTLVFFGRVINQKIIPIEKKITNAGPRPRGFIVEPDSESDEIRKEIISKNRKEGLDTPISDLQ